MRLDFTGKIARKIRLRIELFQLHIPLKEVVVGELALQGVQFKPEAIEATLELTRVGTQY